MQRGRLPKSTACNMIFIILCSESRIELVLQSASQTFIYHAIFSDISTSLSPQQVAMYIKEMAGYASDPFAFYLYPYHKIALLTLYNQSSKVDISEKIALILYECMFPQKIAVLHKSPNCSITV